MNGSFEIVDLTPDTIADYGVCGYKNVDKHIELQNKIRWFKDYYPKGLRIKIVLAQDGSYQGMIEYIPGEYAHRPVRAKGYLFIHCLFVGFKKEFKGQGYATTLIQECIKEAESHDFLGVAIVTRKGSFMVDSPIFVKNGFHNVDVAKPDFELLALKFKADSEDPSFNHQAFDTKIDYDEGLTLLRSPQCPYTEKNVNAILQSAEQKYGIKPTLVEIKNAEEAQSSPCAFGTFCMLHKGEVLTHHPISKRRFENIMDKIL